MITDFNKYNESLDNKYGMNDIIVGDWVAWQCEPWNDCEGVAIGQVIEIRESDIVNTYLIRKGPNITTQRLENKILFYSKTKEEIEYKKEVYTKQEDFNL